MHQMRQQAQTEKDTDNLSHVDVRSLLNDHSSDQEVYGQQAKMKMYTMDNESLNV